MCVAVLFPPPRSVKPGNLVLQALYPPPVPVVVETINPTAASPCSCGDHRSRDLSAVLVVDSKESTTHGVNLVVLPSHLTLHLSFRVFFYHPLFGRLLALCVVPPPLPPKTKTKNHTCVPPRICTNTSSHLTTLPIVPNPLLPYPCCAPYTLPLGHTPVTYPPCHTPSPFHPFTPLLLLPSTIIHASTWCRGRSPSTGPRAPCSLNGTNLGSCSAYATTRSGLSSTPPPGGCCELDQISGPSCPCRR